MMNERAESISLRDYDSNQSTSFNMTDRKLFATPRELFFGCVYFLSSFRSSFFVMNKLCYRAI